MRATTIPSKSNNHESLSSQNGSQECKPISPPFDPLFPPFRYIETSIIENCRGFERRSLILLTISSVRSDLGEGFVDTRAHLEQRIKYPEEMENLMKRTGKKHRHGNWFANALQFSQSTRNRVRLASGGGGGGV